MTVNLAVLSTIQHPSDSTPLTTGLFVAAAWFLLGAVPVIAACAIRGIRAAWRRHSEHKK